jgi:dienelactone hydrolase
MDRSHPQAKIATEAARSRQRSWRRALLALGIIILLASTLLFSWVHMVAEGNRASLLDRKGALISALPIPATPASLEEAVDLLLTSSSGLTAKCRLLPSPEGQALPGVIFLDGIKQGRHVVDYPAIKEINRHAVVISMDYPFDWVNDLGLWDLPRATVAFRQGALDAVSNVLLMVDYLATRPDVDPERIILVGSSFGAPLAVIAGAIDIRPAAVAIMHGGGNLGDLVAHNLRQTGRLGRTAIPPVLAGLMGQAIAWMLTPLEPNRYVPLIAPRPLLMISGSDDELIPRESVLSLFTAARPPKDLRWITSQHLRPREQDRMRGLIQQLHHWLVEHRLF